RRGADSFTRIAESIAARPMPEPLISSPWTRTSGAVTVTTLPLPVPASLAPGSPTSESVLSMTIGPACRPGARRMVSPGAAASMTGWSGVPGATRRSAANAWAADARVQAATTAHAKAGVGAGAGRPPMPGGRRRLRRGAGWRVHHIRSGLDQHPPLHFHMHGMAEPLAVVPVDAGTGGGEGDRCGRLRAELHGDAVVDDRECVRQVFHGVVVGHVDRHFIGPLDLEIGQAERRSDRGHVDPDLVAVTDHVGSGLELDAIGLGLLARVFPHGVVAIPDVDRVDLRAMDDLDVVGL